MKIRTAEIEDAEQLLEIYAPYVKETAITFEYEVPSLDEFMERISNISVKYPYLVIEQDGEILGYAYAGMFHERKAYDWAVEVSIYLKKDKRGNGLGKKLYDMLERVLKEQNILNVNACIAYTEHEDKYLTNGSEKFHEHMGYRLVGKFTKCGYKFDRWYDMIWMEKHIGEHLNNQPPVKLFSEIKEEIKIKYGI